MNERKRDFSKLMDDAEAFRQQVRLAAVQVAGLKPEELAQALAYEVEPFSGIPAPEAEVLYNRVVDPDPTVRVYDVAVKRRKRRGTRTGNLERWLRPVLILAGLIGVALLADGAFLSYRLSSLEKTVHARRPLQTELDRLRRETQTAHAEASAIRSRREAAVRAQDEAAALRVAHADLLDELAAACGERAVVTAMASGEDMQTLNVTAIGVSAEAAAETLRLLTAHAETKGWRVMPGAMSASGTGTTVTFKFDVRRQ